MKRKVGENNESEGGPEVRSREAWGDAGDVKPTFDMALLRVGFGAEFLAPKRRFMTQGWYAGNRAPVSLMFGGIDLVATCIRECREWPSWLEFDDLEIDLCRFRMPNAQSFQSQVHNVEANALSELCNMIFLLLLYFRVGELGSQE